MIKLKLYDFPELKDKFSRVAFLLSKPLYERAFNTEQRCFQLHPDLQG